MKKSTKRKIIKSLAILATATTVLTTASLISNLNKLSQKEIKKIISDINKKIQEINKEVEIIELNSNSIGTYEKAINKAKNNLEESRKMLSYFDNKEFLKYKSILEILYIFKKNIQDLKFKIEDSEKKLIENKNFVAEVIKNATKTLNKVTKIEKNKLSPDLKNAIEKLKNTLNEIEKEKSNNSEEYIDNLVFIAKKAEEDVKKIEVDVQNKEAEEALKQLETEVENYISQTLADKKYESVKTELQKALNEAKKSVEANENKVKEKLDAAKEQIQKAFEKAKEDVKKIEVDAKKVVKTEEEQEKNKKASEARKEYEKTLAEIKKYSATLTDPKFKKVKEKLDAAIKKAKDNLKKDADEVTINKIKKDIEDAKKLAEKVIEGINNIQNYYLSRDEKNNIEYQLNSLNNLDEIDKIIKSAIEINTQKQSWINDIMSPNFELLSTEWKLNSNTFIKVNDFSEAQKRYNTLKEAQKIKKERETSINSLSKELPDWVKNQLLSQLKSRDFKIDNNIKNYNDYDRKYLNELTQEIEGWRQNGLEHIKNLKILDNIKNDMNEFVKYDNNNDELKKIYADFVQFINNNTLVEGNNKNQLITKKQIVEREIVQKFNSFNENMSSFFLKVKNNAIKVGYDIEPDIYDNYKKTLEETKLEIDKYSNKLDNIKQNSDHINKIRDVSRYDQTKQEISNIKNWIEEKISLANKYKELANKVHIDKKINEDIKEKLLSRINKHWRNEKNLNSQFAKLEEDINKEIKNNKQIYDQYEDSKTNLNNEIDLLKEYRHDKWNKNIDKNHDLIVQKYEKIAKDIAEKNVKLSDKITEFEIAFRNLHEYVRHWNEIKTYIEQKAKNDSIKTIAWEKYETETIEIRDKIANQQIKNDTYLFSLINGKLQQTFDEVKKIVFKNEILRLIGNGKWSIKDDIDRDHINLKINDAYVYKKTSNGKYNDIHALDGDDNKSTYSDLKIKFYVKDSQQKSQNPNEWYVWLGNETSSNNEDKKDAIIFSSGDSDGIEYRVQFEDYKTWFRVTVPTEETYKTNKKEYQKNEKNKSFHITDKNLVFRKMNKRKLF
ncbi:hypothetical protein [Metamycoplasma canadense]|uniref:Uncharacterized protein n=1 Tax=Metamycoplasma canadense TaxID=29554 RepID=A0A077L7B6_9BACT|nr:hypothetical protein [Metamycoplasma canadense]BAP39696.1 hypothetical protein MCAN360_0613 [Metamycoplasma canadense]